jgi:hypothetical protein
MKPQRDTEVQTFSRIHLVRVLEPQRLTNRPDLANIRVRQYDGDGWDAAGKSWRISAPEVILPYPPEPTDRDATIASAEYDFQSASTPFRAVAEEPL